LLREDAARGLEDEDEAGRGQGFDHSLADRRVESVKYLLPLTYDKTMDLKCN